MAMTETELKALYQAHSARTAQPHLACPSSDELVALVVGTPPQAARDRMADHLMACADCAREYRLLQSLNAPMVKPAAAIRERRVPLALVWAAAAGLAIAAGAAWISMRQSRDAATPAIAERESPPPPPARDAQAIDASIAALARVDPPPYVTIALRSGVEDRFEAAMDLYARGDYASAAARLRAIGDADPSPPRVPFYLGAAELMIGRPDAAIAMLERVTTTAGHAAYAEHAHFLLAKAWLAKRGVAEARRALTACIALGGAHAEDARTLVQRLDALRSP